MGAIENVGDIVRPADAVHLLLVELILGELITLGSHSGLIAVQYLLVIYLRVVLWPVGVDTELDG